MTGWEEDVYKRQGTKPALYPFTERTHKQGAMISAVDLLKGIAVGTSMKVITVDGANGGLDTNYEEKANAALDVLTKDGYDFVYVHLEGPDEMGHQGSVEKKVKAIERLDERISRPIAEGLAEAGEDFRLSLIHISSAYAVALFPCASSVVTAYADDFFDEHSPDKEDRCV